LDEQLSWSVNQSGTGHGVAIWFDRVVADGIELSNEPGAPAKRVSGVYGTAFFPWPKPVDLKLGDIIAVRIKANLVNDDYVWCWESTVHGGALDEKAKFSQSTMASLFLTFDALKRRGDGIPESNDDTRIDCFILSKIDGRRSLRQIADATAIRFPSSFNSWEQALWRVGEVTSRYGEDQNKSGRAQK
jgi:protein arginine N-methyltransferase 1